LHDPAELQKADAEISHRGFMKTFNGYMEGKFPRLFIDTYSPVYSPPEYRGKGLDPSKTNFDY
jgi:hypothetical protein